MPATIAICTHNRSEYISATIDSVLALVGIETQDILIIDNASTDNTAQIAMQYAEEHSNLRVVSEPVLGIANARNRAIDEAINDAIVFLDDDAIASSGWLQAHLRTLEIGYVCSMGPVFLNWQYKKPSWMTARMESLYSAYNRGASDLDLSPTDYLLTVNAAFNLQTLRDIGKFDKNLGHQGRNLYGGEDNDIFQRLYESGNIVRYTAGAVVVHNVLPERLKVFWIVKRFYYNGIGKSLLNARSTKSGDRIVYDLRILIMYILRLYRPSISRLCDLAETSGRLVGDLRVFRSEKLLKRYIRTIDS
ncbi:MAG: glycosyltransferase [Bacteroidota bacterium]